MDWKYETFGPDGQCKLFGVNIFDYDWKITGKRVKVQDPVYHQEHTFEVWQVEINGQIHRFAAGEFSNCVWGFYLEKDGCCLLYTSGIIKNNAMRTKRVLR